MGPQTGEEKSFKRKKKKKKRKNPQKLRKCYNIYASTLSPYMVTTYWF